MPNKGSATQMRSISHKGVTINVDDCVLVVPETGRADYIGRVVGFAGKAPNDVQVNWFYRPEEVIGGRKLFHGRRELFSSNHMDEIDSATIKRTCQVLGLDAYMAVVAAGKKQALEDVFFTRTQYLAAAKKFKPDRVHVYCFCKMPFNPDLEMTKCEGCAEWYHNMCIQQRGALATAPFTCGQCREESGGGGGGSDGGGGGAAPLGAGEGVS